MPSVLIVEDDPEIVELLYAVLTDEGCEVATLGDLRPDVIRATVGRIEPDCILLDSSGMGGYGVSWETADWLHLRSRPVPTIMFSAHSAAVAEAIEGTSARSQAAGFVAMISKPFELDELLEAVERACGLAVAFDRSVTAEAERTAALVERLRPGGAQDIRASTQREWVTFRTTDGTLVQLYWWQRDGAYYVLRYAATGGTTEQVGRFHDRDTAINLALAVSGEPSDDMAAP